MVRATLPVLLLVMAGCGLAIAKDDTGTWLDRLVISYGPADQ